MEWVSDKEESHEEKMSIGLAGEPVVVGLSEGGVVLWIDAELEFV